MNRWTKKVPSPPIKPQNRSFVHLVRQHGDKWRLYYGTAVESCALSERSPDERDAILMKLYEDGARSRAP